MSTVKWWVRWSEPQTQGITLRLVALPYAGGGATVYRSWVTALSPGIELIAMQLPGRETRISEQPLTTWSMLTATLGPHVLSLTDKPLVLFGHSAGALVAFEHARWLQDKGVLVRALLISGCRAPHLPDRHAPLSCVSDEDLRHELEHLKGTPKEVLNNRELVDLMLPVLRADCILYDTFSYKPSPALDCPIIAFGGNNDPLVSTSEIEAWNVHTSAWFTAHHLSGGHFFLYSNDFLYTLNKELQTLKSIETVEIV